MQATIGDAERRMARVSTLRCLHVQFNGSGTGDELQRQRPTPTLPGVCQRLAHDQLHAAAAAGGQRIHTQPEVVASGLLQQARIDATTGDLLEHLATAVLGHRHRLAQFAIDVQGEAGDLLALAQRELQLTLQHALIGIVELQGDPGLGDAGLHLGLDASLSQLHGLFCCGCDQQRRGGDRRCRTTRRLGRSRPGCQGQQQYGAASGEDHDRTPVGS
ncbi:hypothetical protein D3C73_862940 [compost metagenome]